MYKISTDFIGPIITGCGIDDTNNTDSINITGSTNNTEGSDSICFNNIDGSTTISNTTPVRVSALIILMEVPQLITLTSVTVSVLIITVTSVTISALIMPMSLPLITLTSVTVSVLIISTMALPLVRGLMVVLIPLVRGLMVVLIPKPGQ